MNCRTAVWCLWKAFLSHSWKKVIRFWSPETVVTVYREIIKRRILTERNLSIIERYQNRLYNEKVFQEVWGQLPKEIKILKGPGYLLRPRRSEGSQEGSEAMKFTDFEDSAQVVLLVLIVLFYFTSVVVSTSVLRDTVVRNLVRS